MLFVPIVSKKKKKNTRKKVKCPICDSKGGLSNFKDLDLSSLKQCGECEKEKAVQFCEECDHSFCSNCADLHKKLKISKDHTLVKLPETKHETEMKKSLYCVDCREFLDLKSINSHSKHQLKNLEEGVEIKLTKWNAEVKKITDCRTEYGKYLKRDEECFHDKREELLNIKTRLDHNYEELIEFLNCNKKSEMDFMDLKISRMEDTFFEYQEKLKIDISSLNEDKVGMLTKITKLKSGDAEVLNDKSSYKLPPKPPALNLQHQLSFKAFAKEDLLKVLPSIMPELQATAQPSALPEASKRAEHSNNSPRSFSPEATKQTKRSHSSFSSDHATIHHSSASELTCKYELEKEQLFLKDSPMVKVDMNSNFIYCCYLSLYKATVHSLDTLLPLTAIQCPDQFQPSYITFVKNIFCVVDADKKNMLIFNGDGIFLHDVALPSPGSCLRNNGSKQLIITCRDLKTVLAYDTSNKKIKAVPTPNVQAIWQCCLMANQEYCMHVKLGGNKKVIKCVNRKIVKVVDVGQGFTNVFSSTISEFLYVLGCNKKVFVTNKDLEVVHSLPVHTPGQIRNIYVDQKANVYLCILNTQSSVITVRKYKLVE